jgi:hypothetical protein
MMRRLDPIADESLIREAVAWLDSAPQWFKDCDAAFGVENADAYLEQMKREPQADFGIWDDDEFVAVLTVSLEGKGTYNSHLMAKRRASPEVIAESIKCLMVQMFAQGMLEAWLWLARRNYGVRRILESVGMRRDGVSRIKGQSHGSPIEWLRYSVRAV